MGDRAERPTFEEAWAWVKANPEPVTDEEMQRAREQVAKSRERQKHGPTTGSIHLGGVRVPKRPQ